jgi:hypothetical protein
LLNVQLAGKYKLIKLVIGHRNNIKTGWSALFFYMSKVSPVIERSDTTKLLPSQTCQIKTKEDGLYLICLL